jgi:KEOPS complex subunit Cgi121
MQAEECIIVQYRTGIQDPEAFLTMVRDIAARHGVHIILFNASNMAGMAHVRSALHHAFRAFTSGSAISNSVEMEAFLYASGSRQCQVGIRFGVHIGMNNTYLCICPASSGALEDLLDFGEICNEDWETLSPQKIQRIRELFAISSEELAVVGTSRLTELVLERVALLEVYR